jgi:hypothetical protein
MPRTETRGRQFAKSTGLVICCARRRDGFDMTQEPLDATIAPMRASIPGSPAFIAA